MFLNNAGKDNKKALLAKKERILQEIKYYESRIIEFSHANQNVYFGGNSSDSDDGFPTFLDLGPSIEELKRQDSLLSTCLQATQELTSVLVSESEVNVLIQDPTYDGEKPVTEPGTWREVTAECRIDLVPCSITFFTHQPSRRFAAPSFRALRVLPVKASQEAELEASVLGALTEPSDAVEVLRSYATAYRSRRTTLAYLADKFANNLFMEPLAQGGFVLKCADLLEMSWRLENKLSSVAPFHHKMNFELEYMDESHLKIIKQAHRQLSDPFLQTDKRTQLLANIIKTCLQAQGPQLQESMESDTESIRNLERTILNDEEPTGKDHRTDEEVMAPPKAIPKKAKAKGKENKDENRKAAKRSGSLVTDSAAKKAKITNSGVGLQQNDKENDATNKNNKKHTENNQNAIETRKEGSTEEVVKPNKNNKKHTESNQNAVDSKSEDGATDKAKNVNVKSNKNNDKHTENNQKAMETQKGGKSTDEVGDKAKNLNVKSTKVKEKMNHNLAVNSNNNAKVTQDNAKSTESNPPKKITNKVNSKTGQEKTGTKKSSDLKEVATKEAKKNNIEKNNEEHPNVESNDNDVCKKVTKVTSKINEKSTEKSDTANKEVATKSKKVNVAEKKNQQNSKEASIKNDEINKNEIKNKNNVNSKNYEKTTANTKAKENTEQKTQSLENLKDKVDNSKNPKHPNAKPNSGKQTMISKTQDNKDANAKKTVNSDPANIKKTANSDPANAEKTANSDPANAKKTANSDPANAKKTANSDPANAKKTANSDPANAKKTVYSDPANAKKTANSDPANAKKTANSDPANAKKTANSDPANAKKTANSDPANAKKTVYSDPANAKKTANSDPANAKKTANSDPANAKKTVYSDPANAKKTANSDPANAKKTANSDPANAKKGNAIPKDKLNIENITKDNNKDRTNTISDKKDGLKNKYPQNVKNTDIKLKNNKDKSKILLGSHRNSTGKGSKLNISEIVSKIPKKLSPAYAAVLQQNPLRISPRMVSKLKSSSDSNIQWKPYKPTTNIPRLLKKPAPKSK